MSDPQELRSLIHRTRLGEEEAQLKLWLRVEPLLTMYVAQRMSPGLRRCVGIDDITSIVFCEVLLGINTLPEDASPGELLQRLYAVAKFRIVDQARKLRRFAGESAIPGTELEPAEHPLSTGVVTRGDSLRLLERIIAELPQYHAEVIRLRGIEGQSYVQIGEQLGRSQDAVRKCYEGVVKKLADRFV